MKPIKTQNRFMDEKEKISRKKYRKPVLKTYGLVKNLTQSVGTSNGDGGPTMMA